MFRKFLSMLLVAGFLLVGANAFAMNKTDKVADQKATVTQAKVMAIQGNVITVTDAKGQKRTLELNSVDGIKIGDAVSIEEDPWHARIKIGQKTIGARTLSQ